MIDYDDLTRSLGALTDGERDPIANAANAAALIFRTIPELNWVGFYFLRDEQLVLGPFHGEPATTRIGAGRGVCGAAVAEVATIVVDDVHAFAGHIACDSRSNSEIVVPLAATHAGPARVARLVGVLDIDSPRFARFADPLDRAGIEALARRYVAACDWTLFPGTVVDGETTPA